MTLTADAQPWVSEFRGPRNSAAGVEGSFHNDAIAAKFGFKGGAVGGSVHMDQFVPGLLALYGDAWFETGSLSLYFTQATVDGERVQATVEPGAERARLTMHNEAGARICEGTASVGRDPQSELARRLEAQTPAEPGALRILRHMVIGEEHHDLPVRIEPEALARALETLTEPLPAYRDGRGLPPSQLIGLSRKIRGEVLAKSANPKVGLIGALEVQQFAGPLHAGVDYLARTRVLKLTESPKTENVWHDVIFTDAKGGPDLARALCLLRFFKGSSPLWPSA